MAVGSSRLSSRVYVMFSTYPTGYQGIPVIVGQWVVRYRCVLLIFESKMVMYAVKIREGADH